jgi:signal transduction histidine kinase
MRQLRSLLVELHPPNLHASGLEPALTDLCAPLRAHGVDEWLRHAPRRPQRCRETACGLCRGG